MEVLGNAGLLRGCGVSGMLVRDHVRECTVNGKGRVVVFVAVLSFSEEVNWGVLVFESFPVRLVEARPGPVAVCISCGSMRGLCSGKEMC